MIVISNKRAAARAAGLSALLAAALAGCGGGGTSEQSLGYRLTSDSGPVQPLGNNSATLYLNSGAVSSAVDISATTTPDNALPVPKGLSAGSSPQIVQFHLTPATLSLNTPVTLTLNAPDSGASGSPVIVTADKDASGVVRLIALPPGVKPVLNPALPPGTVTGSLQVNGQSRFSSSGTYEVVYNKVPVPSPPL